ncbi:MAG TPA: trypsin-like serine protease, partial [Actinomycetes bacterium]|nr:trypsin-like serine protease [Actinomycetes bacterium]
YYNQARDSHWWESGRGIRLNICSRDGDSGGPLFDQTNGKGVGILSGGNEGDEDCYSGEPVEYSVYAPLSEIFADLQARTGYSFRLITTTVW